MSNSSRLALRGTLLIVLAALSIGSQRLRADTGTCGGVSITIPFTDVPGGSTFFCSIAAAYFSGLTNGTTGTTYSPGANVTRDQMAAFVTRTQDSALKRGSLRAALGQWAIPTSVPVTGKTAVGINPAYLKSDGEDLWVPNIASSTVSRVHASDGTLLGTWTGATSPNEVVIARGRVFIAGGVGNGAIYVIDPSQPPGAVTTLTSSLPSALSITFDGFNLWVTSGGNGSISRVNPNTGAATTFMGFSLAESILYDGTNIWVSDQGSATVKKVDKVTGAIVLSILVGTSPSHMVFDGANIWVPNFNAASVTVIKASTGVVLATLTGNNLDRPVQAAFDGERILVTNNNNDSVSLWKASDLTPLGFATGATSVGAACSDGLNFWLSLQDGSPGHIVRF